MDLLIKILIKNFGVLDINTKDMEEFGIPLTFNISDIKDFASRKASFSKTIKVLGSKNNNKIFNHLYEIKGDDFNFDMTRRYDCVLLVNNNPVIEGYMVLKNIYKLLIGGTYQIVYELVIFDETKNFFEEISGKELKELDFSSGFTFNNTTYGVGDHVYSESVIASSNNNNYRDIFIYGLVDYGYYTLDSTYPYNDTVSKNILYPQIYLKPVLDKIFDDSDYTYESDFFEGNTYSGLINEIVFLHHKAIEYSDLHCCEYTSDGSFNLLSPFSYDRIEIGKNFCTMNGKHVIYYELDGFNYYGYDPLYGPRVSAEGEYSIRFRMDVTEDRGGLNDGGTTNPPGDTFYRINKYNAEDDFHETVETFSSSDFRTAALEEAFYIDETITGITANKGDFYYLSIKTGYYARFDEEDLNIRVYADGCSLELINKRALEEEFTRSTNPTLYINEILPEMDQSSFLKNLIKMFNLYIYSDSTNPKKLFIEPRDDFYKAGDIVNWTEKLDYNKNIKIQTLNDYIANDINFKMKPGDDFYSQQYINTYIETYGDKIINLGNPYLKEKKVIGIDFQSYLMRNENTSLIPKLYENENSQHTYYEDRTEFEPMLGFIDKVTGLIRFGNYETTTTRNGYITNPIPYVTHASILGGFSFDLNYETETGYTFTLTDYDPNRGLYNIFWENYINDIIDDSSRMVTMYIHLSLQDIITLNFKNRILIDGQMYYLQKIEYDPSLIRSSKVILLKEIDPIAEGSFETDFLLKNDSGDYILTSAGNKILIN